MDSLAPLSEQIDVAAQQKLKLCEDLAEERAKVAEMQKSLEAKDGAIADSEDRESRIKQRLREETAAKERARVDKHMLAARLGYVLRDTGRQISDLKKQVVMEQSAGTSKLQENDRLTTQWACEISANKDLARKIHALESELQQKNKELSAIQKASIEERDWHVSLVSEMDGKLVDRNKMIDELEEVNRTLHEQTESAREAHNHLQRSHEAAKMALGVAQQAALRLEKEMRSQDTRRVEDTELARRAIEQETRAKQEALKGMVSIKEILERKLSEQAALELRLKLECGKVRSELARSVRSRQELDEESAHQRDRLSTFLQNALVERDQAAEDYTKSKHHLGTMFQEQFQARVQLERQYNRLDIEIAESRRAWARKEKETRERESLLFRRLHSMDLGFRDQEAKCGRAEEELRLWKEQNGVIVLD